MIIIRNFRYRHPISDEILTDWLTDIYEHLVDLIGINNNIATKDGIIKEKLENATTNSTLEIESSDFIEFEYLARRTTRS